MEPDRAQRVALVNTAAPMYTFVPYLPQAVGVLVGRTLGRSSLEILYLGRLTNLAFAAAMVWLAIRLAPMFKRVLGLTALLPITVQQFASQSPDASLIAVSFLAFAILLRIVVGETGRAAPRDIAAAFVLGVWLGLCKFLYAPIVLIAFATPALRSGSTRRSLMVALALAAVTLGAGYASAKASRSYVPIRKTLGAYITDIDVQQRYVAARPLRFLKAVMNTSVVYTGTWVHQLGVLGILDTPMPPQLLYGLMGILVLLALADRPPGFVVPLRVRAAAVAAAASCALLIFLSLYVWWTKPGARIVEGIQGRFFVPILPLALLGLASDSVRVMARPAVLTALAASSGAGGLVVAVATIACRYYLPDRPPSTPVTVATLCGLGLVAACVGMASSVGRPGRRPEDGPAGSPRPPRTIALATARGLTHGPN